MQTVGSVRPAPAPSSKVAGEMLNVLSAFGGGDKKLRQILEKIEETQKYNENVIEQAQTARSEAIQLQRTAQALFDEATQLKGEADTAKTTLEHLTDQTNRDLEAQRQKLTGRETKVVLELAASEVRVKRETKEGDARLRDLDERQGHVERRESQIKTMTEAFRGHVSAIADAHSLFSELQSSVNRLNDWIESVKTQ